MPISAPTFVPRCRGSFDMNRGPALLACVILSAAIGEFFEHPPLRRVGTAVRLMSRQTPVLVVIAGMQIAMTFTNESLLFTRLQGLHGWGRRLRVCRNGKGKLRRDCPGRW
jgi:hypothetical protein